MGKFADALRETRDFDLPEKEDEKSPSALVKDFQKESQQMQLGLSIEQTTDVNPDEHAEALTLSKEVGLPADSVRQDMPTYREQARKKKVNYSELLKNHPKLSKSLSDPDFSKVAADDIEVLKSVEDALRIGLIKKGYYQSQAAGEIQSAGRISEEIEQLKMMGGKISGLTYSETQKKIDELMGGSLLTKTRALGIDFLSSTSKEFGDATTKAGLSANLIQQVAQVDKSAALEMSDIILNTYVDEAITSLQKAEAIPESKALTAMAETEDFGGAISAFADAPIDTVIDALASSAYPMAEVMVTGAAGSPLGPAGFVIGTYAGSFNVNYKSKFMEVLTQEGVNISDRESLKAALQDRDLINKANKDAFNYSAPIAFFDAASGGIASKTLAATKLRNTLAQTGVQMGFGAGGEAVGQYSETGKISSPGEVFIEGIAEAPGGIIEPMILGKNRVFDNVRRIRKSKENQLIMEALGEASAESKTRQRVPEQYQDFVNEVTKDGPVENIIISAEKFDEYFQTQGINVDEVIKDLPGVGEQLIQARERNGDIYIPLNLYAGKIAGTEHHAGLIQDIKFNPTELSPREALEMKEKMPEILEDYIKMEQEAIDRQITDQDSYDRILEAATTMQVEGGELRTQSVKRAELLARTFTTLGERYNLDPVQLFEGYGIEVRGAAQQEIIKVDDLDAFISKARETKTEESKTLINYLLQKDINLATATNEEVKLALQGAEQPITEGVTLFQEPAYKDAPTVFDSARDKFLSVLPEDADFIEAMDAVDSGDFSSEYSNFLKALERDDWLGFDYPSQAVNAALSDELESYEVSRGLKQSIGRLVNADPSIFYQEVKGFKVTIEAIEEETGRTIKISENADIALKEVDDSISTLQELIKCVG
jgi:hypothetical protein